MLTQARVVEALGKIYASPYTNVTPLGVYQIGSNTLFGPIVIGSGSSWDEAIADARAHYPQLNLLVYYGEVLQQLVVDITNLVNSL